VTRHNNCDSRSETPPTKTCLDDYKSSSIHYTYTTPESRGSKYEKAKTFPRGEGSQGAVRRNDQAFSTRKRKLRSIKLQKQIGHAKKTTARKEEGDEKVSKR
jgi:hypothetical protein